MKIIIAPLNWGIGHATRCIPIIRYLRQQGHEVHMASDRHALSVLKEEFPTLAAHSLPSYGITYKYQNIWKNSFSFAKNILKTIPKERKAISALAKKIGANVIISDNRFGCYADFTANYFITHQVVVPISTTEATNMAERVIHWFNRWYMGPFDEIWVPDFEGQFNLSGKMAHQTRMDNVRFLGPLSRFSKTKESELIYDAIVILSGPEPQRTVFEQLLLLQIEQSPLHIMLVRGLPNSTDSIQSSKATVHDFLNQHDLLQAISQSKMVISRSGYSTVMDLFALQKPAIFVPTPGQPEQEYIANKLKREGQYHFARQDEFDLDRDSRIGLGYDHFTKVNEDYSGSLERALSAVL